MRTRPDRGILNAQDLTWPDPGANHVIPMQSSVITHGPIVGHVTSNSEQVWVRASREVEFDVPVSSNRPPFDEVADNIDGSGEAGRGSRLLP